MRKKKQTVSQERVLEELAAIGFARVTDLVAVENDKLVLKDTGEDSTAAIAGIEHSSGGVKVKFYDKMQALELLGKQLGLFDGKAVRNQAPQSNLLTLFTENTREAISTDDIPELQQATADCHDLVEPAGDGDI